MDTLSTLKNKKFYYFCVDRFSRNLVLGSQWLENIKKNNSKIYFVQENLEYPREGPYFNDFNDIISCITKAQQFSEQISDRVKFANNAKKQRGEFSQTSAFGCSFEENRIYELKIIALINLLKWVGHGSMIQLYYLKTHHLFYMNKLQKKNHTALKILFSLHISFDIYQIHDYTLQSMSCFNLYMFMISI